jgi:hypothetical protein
MDSFRQSAILHGENVDIATSTRLRRLIGVKQVIFGSVPFVLESGAWSIYHDVKPSTASSCRKVLADLDEDREQNQPTDPSMSTFLHLDNATLHRLSRDYEQLGITKLCHGPDHQDSALGDFCERNPERKDIRLAIQSK